MTPLAAATLIVFIGLVVIVVFAFVARASHVKFVNSQKEVINNIISLVNSRNTSINSALQEHITWLVDDFNGKCIELFMSDTYLIAMKEKYNIPDSEFVLAFQNVIGDVQNINRMKTQELLTKVSNSMIAAVKEQIGEK